MNEFWDKLRDGLSRLLAILSDPPPTCRDEVVSFQNKVRDIHGEIASLLLRPPWTNQQSVGDALELLHEQVVERDSPEVAALVSSRGLLKWFEELDIFLGDF